MVSRVLDASYCLPATDQGQEQATPAFGFWVLALVGERSPVSELFLGGVIRGCITFTYYVWIVIRLRITKCITFDLGISRWIVVVIRAWQTK